MITLNVLKKEFEGLGYRPEALIEGYTFADVLAQDGHQRRVELAAFTQAPASYRTAAFGVVMGGGACRPTDLQTLRALGAPLVICVKGNALELWQINAKEPAKKLLEVLLAQLPHLFEQHATEWAPTAIHRAKLIGQFEQAYQLDFVDLGLIPVIESEIHLKLDRLLNDILAEAIGALQKPGGRSLIDYQFLFRLIFRLLAAKILLDRQHPISQNWPRDNVHAIVDEICRYYGFPQTRNLAEMAFKQVANNAWQRLLRSIDFRNISSDDLAFVYETTLVSDDIRETLGTHSTPRSVAEYVVSHLRFDKLNLDDIHVYEPFGGSSVFLVSAMRHLRGLQPPGWNDWERHEYFVNHISGSEIDPFAREVANLSLILADYPNHNGWHLYEEDLFKGHTLAKRLKTCSVALCNPPFEDFTVEQRQKYTGAAVLSVHKPIAVLNAVVERAPEMIGFVLPSGFISGKQYVDIRRRIERSYADIELVSLPDRIFRESTVESALLIAQELRPQKGVGQTTLKSTTVHDVDRVGFLRQGDITSHRTDVRRPENPKEGELWVEELNDVWMYLQNYPTLGTFVDIHRGLEWKYNQSQATSRQSKQGFRRGIHTINGALESFAIRNTVYIDCNKQSLRGNAIRWPWEETKIIANAVRLSRGSWRIAAAIDSKGLVCSQQFFGIWPKVESPYDVYAITAILNSPLCNAFLAVHDPKKGIRVSTLEKLPLPPKIDTQRLRTLVDAYHHKLTQENILLEEGQSAALERLLLEIDAEVLSAYDLPPRLERSLLDYFRGYDRPVSCRFHDYFPQNFTAWIPLQTHLSSDFETTKSGWLHEVLRPITGPEAEHLADYLKE